MQRPADVSHKLAMREEEIDMTQRTTRWLALPLALAGALALTACDRQPGEPTAGQKLDETIAKADAATEEARNDVREATAEVRQDASQATAEARAETKEAINDAQATVQDATITAKVNAALAADDRLSALKIDVDTKNGAVTLRGTAPDPVSVSRATELASAVEGVTTVNNELRVGANNRAS